MTFKRDIRPIQLAGYPPHLEQIFNLLSAAGAEHYALFGGAIRDADHAARNNSAAVINDYDLRVWMAEHQVRDFVGRLAGMSATPVAEVPSAGTGRIRYCFNFRGAELDISVRPMPPSFDGRIVPPEAAAVDRAGDADIGLCSVAIDPNGQAWGTREYELDQKNATLSVYPIDDAERRTAYATRMQAKFPNHRLVWLP